MRIAFIGAVELSRKALTHLIEMQSNIVGVCTLKKSTINSDHNDLSDLCEINGISWTYAPDINSDESIKWLGNKGPDVIFCIGWSRLLGKRLLHLAPLGVIGFHPAALPVNRGRHPIVWALALGLHETAATFFFMDEGADTGDILSQKTIEIDSDDDAGSLYEKITRSALEQISILVPQLSNGSFIRTPQNKLLGNTWRKRGKEDGQIDWRMSACSIHNLVRSLTKPYVGAHFVVHGKEVKVWKTETVTNSPVNIEPGKVLEVAHTGPVIKCGEHAIRLLKTEPEFKPVVGDHLEGVP